MKHIASQTQTLHLAPQQFQVAKLIQATSEELEKLINEEISNNFVLEADDNVGRGEETSSSEDDDSYGDNVGSEYEEGDMDEADRAEKEEKEDSMVFYGDDEEDQPAPTLSSDDEAYSPLVNMGSDETFREQLMTQLDEMDLSEDELLIAKFLVDSLDDSGYLLCPLSKVVDDLAILQHYDTDEACVEQVLTDVVQSLVPAGIGARDLRECLLLQLQEMTSSPSILLAYDIIDQYFEDFSEKRYERLCLKLKITKQKLADAIKVILHLSPKPGGQSSSTERMETRASKVRPDFTIRCKSEEEAESSDELIVKLNDRLIPTVRISEDAKEMLERIQKNKTRSEDDKKGIALLKENIASGNQFIDSLRQRHETLKRVIQVLSQLQKDYFLSCGDPDTLKPMVLQDVADLSGYDVSTISRVSNSKYIDTDFGIIAVKDLFTSAIQTDQGSISNAAVLETLKEILDNEDKKNPLSDDALSDLLKEKGYPVARRTVAKYRERLNYPTARMRREA